METIEKAMQMVKDARKRMVDAEYQIRKMKRALKRWEPLACSICSTENPEESVLTVTLSAKISTEEAYQLAEKLGLETSKLDAIVC